MATTKRKLSEQVLRRLSSGDRSVGSKYHQLEIDEAVMQVVNSLIRPQYFETLQTGNNEDEGFVLCTYDLVPVVAYKGTAKASLPAIPVNLPRNAGVHRVYNANDVLSNAFIPASAAEMELIASQPILSNLLGQYAYKVRGTDLIFNKDLTAQSPAITAVSMELVVMDYSKFSDTQLLPINADMEAQVVDTVFKMFVGEQTQAAIIDSTSDTK